MQKIKAADPQFESSHIVVVSHNGVVLLAGEVGTEALKLKAAEVVASMEHVASVHNELEIERTDFDGCPQQRCVADDKSEEPS